MANLRGFLFLVFLFPALVIAGQESCGHYISEWLPPVPGRGATNSFLLSASRDLDHLILERTGRKELWATGPLELALAFDYGVSAMDLSPSGKYLVVGYKDSYQGLGYETTNQLVILNRKTFETVLRYEWDEPGRKGETKKVSVIKHSPRGRYLVAISNTGVGKVIDLKRQSVIEGFDLNAAPADVQFSADGSAVVISGREGSVWYKNIVARTPMRCILLQSHNTSELVLTYGAKLSSNGRFVIAGTSPGSSRIGVWDVKRGVWKRSLSLGQYIVAAVPIPETTKIALLTEPTDEHNRLLKEKGIAAETESTWDYKTGEQELFGFSDLIGDESNNTQKFIYSTALEVSRDGRYFVTGDNNGEISIVDAQTLKQLDSFTPAESEGKAIVFLKLNRAGTNLLVGFEDQRVVHVHLTSALEEEYK